MARAQAQLRLNDPELEEGVGLRPSDDEQTAASLVLKPWDDVTATNAAIHPTRTVVQDALCVSLVALSPISVIGALLYFVGILPTLGIALAVIIGLVAWGGWVLDNTVEL